MDTWKEGGEPLGEAPAEQRPGGGAGTGQEDGLPCWTGVGIQGRAELVWGGHGLPSVRHGVLDFPCCPVLASWSRAASSGSAYG